MAKLTIKRARKILGNQAKQVSDDEIARDIQVAELLKNIFFNKMRSNLKDLPNNNNAKT
jgi:hypothetical protein